MHGRRLRQGLLSSRQPYPAYAPHPRKSSERRSVPISTIARHFGLDLGLAIGGTYATHAGLFGFGGA
jgi:hypothetical protein